MSKEIINLLNNILQNEIFASNKFFLNSRVLKDKGIDKLADKLEQESIEERDHASLLIDRILFLKGDPNINELQNFENFHDVSSMFNKDLQIEKDAIDDLKSGILTCENHLDYGTRDLLVKILIDEENHYDWIETQIELIDLMGVENYIQNQS